MIQGSSGSRLLLHSKGEREREKPTNEKKKRNLITHGALFFFPLEYFRYLCSYLVYQHSGQVNSFL